LGEGEEEEECPNTTETTNTPQNLTAEEEVKLKGMLFVKSITVKELKGYLQAYGQKVSDNKQELANQFLVAMNNNTIVEDDDLEGHGDDGNDEKKKNTKRGKLH
jgi:hypothetical protein